MLKKINRIKTSFWERNLSLVKISYQVIISKFLEAMSKNPNNLKRVEGVLEEFSELKGSLMKAGQLLTVYGQSYLPPDALKTLEKLQEFTSYVEVEEIERIIIKSGSRILDDYTLEPIPFASASIGQVHLATSGNTNKVVKVQYPGIEKSIAIDLLVLKSFLKFFKFLPKKLKLDGLFKKIEEMLNQEIDYEQERSYQINFSKRLSPDYIIPEIDLDYSNSKILVTNFVTGLRIQDALELSQEMRNKLGSDLIELVLREIFEIQMIQTDPNPANFKIDRDKGKWILYDFGACQEIPIESIKHYRSMITGLVNTDYDEILKAFEGLGALKPDDSSEYKECLLEYAEVLMQVFQPEEFDWKNNNLELQLLEKGKKLLKLYSHDTPPYETIFIDRKISGIFFMLRMLEVKMSANQVVGKYLT